jgi:sugar/nucleoside kinase (ribokinase family)
VSVDLSSWSAIRDLGVARFVALLEDLAPDTIFANEEEERIVGGRIGDGDWIVKRGAAGASFNGTERAAHPIDGVVDSTGAGDAFAAGWLVGGADLALDAAGRCVQQVGSMPART